MSFSFINFIIYPLVYIIFTPVLTLIHEFGHAIPALIFTKDEVSINIGNSNQIKQIKFNRLIIYINRYRSIMDVSYGIVNWKPIKSKLKSIIMVAGGPIVSLCTSITFYLLLDKIELSYLIIRILDAILLFSICQFISTMLPIKYGDYSPYKGITSDGYKILRLLKSNNES